MHNVVSRLALSVLASAALLAGVLVAAGPAAADTAPLRPSQPDKVSGGGYTPLATPARLLDTRDAKNPLQAGESRAMPAVTKVDVPADAAAVVVNLTAVTPRADGYLSAFPGTTRPSPLVSNLNFTAGVVVANAAVVKIANGTFTLLNGSSGSTDVVVDVTGWFAAGGSTDGAFTAVAPTRLIDTRTPPNAAIPAGGTLVVAVRGKAGIPSAAGAAVLNVTVAKPGSQGYLTLYPGGTAPAASNVNFAKGQTVAGLAAVALDANGRVTIRNASSAAVQVTVDVAGWFQGTTARLANNFSFLAPARVFDTRSPKTTLTPGQTRAFPVLGRGGVPTSGVAAVVLTVTVTNPQAAGYLTVYPGGTRPLASTLNFARGQTVPNLVVVPVASNGTISVSNGSGGAADVLADVAGFVRSNDLDPPSASTSRYVNDLRPTQSNAQITATMQQYGCDDITAVTDGDDHFTLLEFGAQSNKAGNGSQLGVRLVGTPDPNNPVRLTYAQVVTAVKGYLDGIGNCRTENATGAYTVGVGTSNDGYRFPSGATVYLPAAKGADWASQVVTPLVSYGAGVSVDVVGANDIEANFDGTAAEVKTWVQNYLAGNSLQLVNNGAAAACPTVLGQTGRSCGAVRVDGTSATQTWSQADYVAFSYGLGTTRISVLPQIYFPENAIQWQNINLTAGGRLRFAGVLTQVGACGSTPGCGDLSPADAWTDMRQALDSNDASDGTVLPTVTDIDYDS